MDAFLLRGVGFGIIVAVVARLELLCTGDAPVVGVEALVDGGELGEDAVEFGGVSLRIDGADHGRRCPTTGLWYQIDMASGFARSA